MDFEKLAELLFPNVTETAEEVEARYPERNLPEGAKVTRIAPSPTGFMHLGNLFGAITDERLAHQSGGVFFLRIEDTDAKRAVEGGVETIINVFKKFGLNFDEGALIDGEKGDYGPYRQRQRASLYHVFAKKLVSEGKAYPCFCTEDDLAKMREQQEAEKANPGYYGKWATHRDMPLEEVEKALAEEKSWVLRFRSEGDAEKYLHLNDLVKGKIDMPENDQDIVLLKSDGIPTYHFAHVVDDHLMKTTHVVRGEEWLATWPIHVQLFSALGWKMPKYVHTAQLMKMDGESKRKLSKRKDPELALDFYFEEGYPVPSVIEYLLTLLNSNFEEWRLANPKEPYENFKFTTNKMSVSGSLFDLDKLRDVSKNVVAMLTTEKVWEYFSDWAEKYDTELYGLLTRDKDFSVAMFNFDRNPDKPRKDIAKFSEVRNAFSFMFDEIMDKSYEYPENISKEDMKKAAELYIDMYSENDEKDIWFNKMKDLAEKCGFCREVKEYKQNPDAFKGHVGDISSIIRVAVTGRMKSPDLWGILKTLGKEKVTQRLNTFIATL